MKLLRSVAAVGAVFAMIVAPVALAAGLWPTLPIVGEGSFCAAVVGSGPTQGGITGQGAGSLGGATICAQTVPAGPALTGTENVPADTGAAGGASPPTVVIPTSVLAGSTWGTPRNFLGNSSLLGTQVNGTGTVTCATTSAPTTAALSADRWACDANVTSGVGRSAIITASPAPPAGFTNSMKVWRNSAALTQPVCTWQAIPTPQATQLAGQTVTFSAYVAALAGLAADNGGVANLVIISGTGTDQGINGSWTASPAITPAWTGITTVVNTPITLTTTFARFSTTAAIPSTATEVGVALCFTPTATGSGTTDGFAFTGAQLEKAPAASLYEVRARQAEIADNAQFLYVVTEGAASTIRAMCTSSTTSIEICGLQFPVPMYKTPTMSYTAGFASCTTTACTALVACTAVRTSTGITGMAPTATNVPLDCTSSAGFPAAGSATFLADNAGSGVIVAWTGL